jgi:Ca2+-transporting ATPase
MIARTGARADALGSRAADLGLTTRQACDRFVEVGPNTVTRVPQQPLGRRIARALREPLVLVLLAAMVLTTVTGDVADTVVILLVVLVNTAVAVWQETSADRAVAALEAMAAPVARVVRDGAEREVPVAEVVPGDLVVLAEGDVVPADAQVVHSAALRVDEAALTGESVPVDRESGEPVLAGTTVVHGRARAVVTATGDASTLGRIAALLGGPRTTTPLQRRMAQLSVLIAGAVVALCVLVLALGLARGEDLEVMLLTAVTLAVAAVPESLPVVVTLSLALAARRMARRHAVVRTLAAVETLGSVTLLATDKTGTLTEGSMSVVRTWTAPGASADALLRAAALCNDAVLGDDGTLLGDPTEAALLVAARASGLDPASVRAAAPRVGETPFDSRRKTMTTVHAVPGGHELVVVKGAPEAVLADARLRATVGGDEAARLAEEWSADGLRVLAVGEGDAHRVGLLGLVALHDPPREAAARTVAACRDAGIRMVLVTGDHARTAGAVARRVGLSDGHVVDLADPDVGSTTDAVGHDVLARATPEDKLAAVQAWQQQGHVVAMTGDGVNDGPALRRADIGVAMGRRGTEVARQAADLVLTDDDIGTVVAAVEEGRRVYANVRRFLLYGLSGGLAEVLVMLAGPFTELALPLLPAQILWVNLLTHSLAGTALGAEPAEPAGMKRRPRDPAEGVLGGGLWWRIAALGAVLGAMALAAGVALLAGDGAATARSAVLLAVGAGQLGVALGARARRTSSSTPNVALPVTVALSAALLAAAVLLPPLQALLGTAAVPASGWISALGAAVVGWACARALSRTRRS